MSDLDKVKEDAAKVEKAYTKAKEQTTEVINTVKEDVVKVEQAYKAFRSSKMFAVYIGIALVLGAVIFFAVLRYNKDWAGKLLMNEATIATNQLIAEKTTTITNLTAQLASLESVNGELGIKLYQLSSEMDKLKNSKAKILDDVKGKKKSEVADEFNKLGY